VHFEGSFIQPNVGFKGHAWEALGVGYLISYLKSRLDVDVDFYSGFYDSDDTILDGCSDSYAVCFSCTSPQVSHALRLAESIKGSSDTITIMGGAHVSAEPRLLPNIDKIVCGEGEIALVNALKSNGSYFKSGPCDIDSLPFQIVGLSSLSVIYHRRTLTLVGA